MDIEIQIRTGSRRCLKKGTIKWEGYRDASHLVKYTADEKGAIREALYQVKRMLHESLGVDDMRKT